MALLKALLKTDIILRLFEKLSIKANYQARLNL